MSDTENLKTPMDVYLYVLSLNDEEKWAETGSYMGVFPHLRTEYGVWDCAGVMIVNNLIDQLETAIIDRKPANFLRAVKNAVHIGNQPAPDAGRIYVKDYLCSAIHDWNTGVKPDPWRYD